MSAPAIYEAAKEILRRRDIRGSLTAYARHCGFEPAKHHQIIISAIEEFLASDLDVLLIFAPPGSAKSTYISVLLPAWYLANHPSENILFATHSVEFAERWGRRVRNDVTLNSKVLDIELDSANQAAGRWALRQGGEYYAVGAGTGISGFRADLGIIDDPFGSREDAWSETTRAKRWQWYQDDFSPRLKPHAKRIVMHTRWHEEDIAGMILQQAEKGQIKAKVISIPAIATEDDPVGRAPGTYLWDDPEGYNYGEFLRARQRETSPMMWSALYQQSPAPEEGDYFKAGWFRTYDELPGNLNFYGASDCAVTSGDGVFTVHLIVGLDQSGKMYLADMWRQQAASDAWVEAQCDMVLRWKPLEWAHEAGQIKAGVGPFLNKRMVERKAYCYVRTFPTRGDKAVRAQSIRGRLAMGGIYLPSGSPWAATVLKEALSFPAGKHDDIVDALGLIGQCFDHFWTPKDTTPKEEPKPVWGIYASSEPGLIAKSSFTWREMMKRHTRRRDRLGRQ